MSCPDTSSFWDLKICRPNFKIFALQPPLPCWRVLKLKSAHPTPPGTMSHPIIYSSTSCSGLLHGRGRDRVPSWVDIFLTGHSICPYGANMILLPKEKKNNGGACNVDIKGSLLFVESCLTMVTLDVITKLNGFHMTQQSKAVREKQRDWLCFSTEDGGTWDTSLFGNSSATRTMNW